MNEDEILIRKEDIPVESECKVKTVLVNFTLENILERHPPPGGEGTSRLPLNESNPDSSST